MDTEGDLVLGRPFLKSAKARIDVGREDMFFRFKKKEEQRFMIQQDSEGQALWGGTRTPARTTTLRTKKKEEGKEGVVECREFGLV